MREKLTLRGQMTLMYLLYQYLVFELSKKQILMAEILESFCAVEKCDL